MSHHKQYKDESQDARRRDKHDATHPYEDRADKNHERDKELHPRDKKRK